MPDRSTVDIGLVLPDVLGTYGDGGNAEILARRLQWRGIPARVVEIRLGQPVPQSLHVYVLGGGEDAAGELAARQLSQYGFANAIERGAAVFAVCAGMQILGHEFTGHDGRPCRGLGVLDIRTEPMARRAVGELLVEPNDDLLDQPMSGFENHQGGTFLGPAARPLGRVAAGVGNGDGVDGAIQGRIIATYMHGAAFARNPRLADAVLGRAIGGPLPPLDLREVDELRQSCFDRVAAQSRQPSRARK